MIRCGSSPSPFPFRFSISSRIRYPTASRRRQRGARVVVPLGKRVVTGIVVDPDATLDVEQTPADKIKPILEVLDDEAFLPGAVVDLALWVAEYYACGAGDALAAAVPSTQAHKTIRVATLTAQGHDDAASMVSAPALPDAEGASTCLRGAPTAAGAGAERHAASRPTSCSGWPRKG